VGLAIVAGSYPMALLILAASCALALSRCSPAGRRYLPPRTQRRRGFHNWVAPCGRVRPPAPTPKPQAPRLGPPVRHEQVNCDETRADA